MSNGYDDSGLHYNLIDNNEVSLKQIKGEKSSITIPENIVKNGVHLAY